MKSRFSFSLISDTTSWALLGVKCSLINLITVGKSPISDDLRQLRTTSKICQVKGVEKVAIVTV